MRDIINSILDNSRERLKNPFIGSFLIAWIVFNWKPIFYFLFSDDIIKNRISLVVEKYSNLDYNLWLPLIVATFYVTIFPYLMWILDLIPTKATTLRKANSVNQKIRDLKSKLRFVEIETEIERTKAEYKNKADLNKKISELNNVIKKKDQEIGNLKISKAQWEEERKDMEIALNNSNENVLTANEKEKFKKDYEEFKESELFPFFQPIGTEIRNYNSVPNNIDSIVIEKFMHTDIIKEFRDRENQNTYYNFTKKGKFFWKEYVLGIKISKDDDELFEDTEYDDLPF